MQGIFYQACYYLYKYHRAAELTFDSSFMIFNYKDEERHKPIRVLVRLAKLHKPLQIMEPQANLKKEERTPTFEELYTALAVALTSFPCSFLAFDALG